MYDCQENESSVYWWCDRNSEINLEVYRAFISHSPKRHKTKNRTVFQQCISTQESKLFSYWRQKWRHNGPQIRSNWRWLYEGQGGNPGFDLVTSMDSRRQTVTACKVFSPKNLKWWLCLQFYYHFVQKRLSPWKSRRYIALLPKWWMPFFLWNLLNWSRKSVLWSHFDCFISNGFWWCIKAKEKLILQMHPTLLYMLYFTWNRLEPLWPWQRWDKFKKWISIMFWHPAKHK